jgi:hypothetical protein
MIFASEASLFPLLSKSGFPFAARADSSHYPIERLMNAAVPMLELTRSAQINW